MKNDTVIKVALGALVIFFLLPVVPKIVASLRPPPPSFERLENALRAANLSVDSVTPIVPPQLDAIFMVAMYVNGTPIYVYEYDNEGKIATQLAYQKEGPETVALQATGIASAFGLRSRRSAEVLSTRKGLFMLVIVGEDKTLNAKIAKIFENL